MVQDYYKRFPKSYESAHHADDLVPKWTPPLTLPADRGKKKTPPPVHPEPVKIHDQIDSVDDDDGGNVTEEVKIPHEWRQSLGMSGMIALLRHLLIQDCLRKT